MVSSVILIPPSNPSQIQSSQGSQNVRAGTFSEGVVATKEPEVFSSVVDSIPPNPISSEPRLLHLQQQVQRRKKTA
ncbi:hypothetical protein ABFA07_021370 [Porites harrisoni]